MPNYMSNYISKADITYPITKYKRWATKCRGVKYISPPPTAKSKCHMGYKMSNTAQKGIRPTNHLQGLPRRPQDRPHLSPSIENDPAIHHIALE